MDMLSLRGVLREAGVHIDEGGSNPNKLVCFCPFAPYKHKAGADRRPSFAAFPHEDKVSGYTCKACGMKGSIVSMMASLHSASGDRRYHELYFRCLELEQGARLFKDYEDIGEDLEPPVPLNAAMYGGLYPFADEVPEAFAYINGRGISASTIRKLGICYDEEERRVLFPVKDTSGNLYGFSGRAIYKDPKIKVRDYAGLKKKWLILGSDHWAHGKPVLIVEGLFGYAWLHEIGASDIVNIGAIMGAEMTREKANILKEYDEPVYLLLDNDDGGDKGTYGPDMDCKKGAVAELREYLPLYVPDWPKGKLDEEGNPQEDVQKDDPDQLTLSEIVSMLADTDPII